MTLTVLSVRLVALAWLSSLGPPTGPERKRIPPRGPGSVKVGEAELAAGGLASRVLAGFLSAGPVPC